MYMLSSFKQSDNDNLRAYTALEKLYKKPPNFCWHVRNNVGRTSANKYMSFRHKTSKVGPKIAKNQNIFYRMSAHVRAGGP